MKQALCVYTVTTYATVLIQREKAASSMYIMHLPTFLITPFVGGEAVISKILRTS